MQNKFLVKVFRRLSFCRQGTFSERITSDVFACGRYGYIYVCIYILATAYRPLLVWPLKTKATGTGNESTAGQPNDDSNVSARQRQGN